MHKTLTIVIPSYNMESYLPRCIDSLGIDSLNRVVLPNNGTLGDRLEVLIVNDGSTDKTSEIAHGFELRYPQTVRAIDKPNGHYGSCVNRGLAEANGTFIKILDADDSFDTSVFCGFLKALSALENSHDDEETDLVMSGFQRIRFDGSPFENSVEYSYPTDVSFGVDRLVGREAPYYLMPALTYRTERLRLLKYRQTEGVLYTDTEWVVLPLCKVRKIRYWPGALYLYSIGREGQSMNEAVWRANLQQCIEVRKNIVQFVAQQTDFASNENRKVVRTFVLKYLVGIYLRFYLEFGSDEMSSLLRPFDESIKAIDAEMYGALRSVSFPSRMGFHLIRFWQDHKWSNRWVSCYLNVYSRLAKMVARLLRK